MEEPDVIVEFTLLNLHYWDKKCIFGLRGLYAESPHPSAFSIFPLRGRGKNSVPEISSESLVILVSHVFVGLDLDAADDFFDHVVGEVFVGLHAVSHDDFVFGGDLDEGI